MDNGAVEDRLWQLISDVVYWGVLSQRSTECLRSVGLLHSVDEARYGSESNLGTSVDLEAGGSVSLRSVDSVERGKRIPKEDFTVAEIL
jgi:hypothetical protein